MDLDGIQRTVQIARMRLFGEDDGNAAEMLRGNGGNTDSGRLDGNDFGDGRSVETAAEFTPDLDVYKRQPQASYDHISGDHTAEKHHADDIQQ